VGSIKRYFAGFAVSFLFLLPVRAEETVIPLKMSSGVYYLPVELNRVLTVDFILDSGAAEVTIPADVVLTLVRTGTVSPEDFLPGKSYSLADGTVVQSPRFILRSIKVGNLVFHNIPAGIGNVESHLLLGQSLLTQLDSWTLDQTRQALIINSTGSFSVSDTAPEVQINSVSKTAGRQDEKKFKTPEGAVQEFFRSIADGNFEVSWLILSAYSQNKIVEMVSLEEEQISPSTVRTLFDSNHPRVREGFWMTFRNSSGIADIIPYATFHRMSKRSDMATVQVRVNSEALDFRVYREDGRWKMGLIESVELNNTFTKKQ
jgi:hypothetical protein